jgi:hypothetical protein
MCMWALCVTSFIYCNVFAICVITCVIPAPCLWLDKIPPVGSTHFVDPSSIDGHLVCFRQVLL